MWRGWAKQFCFGELIREKKKKRNLKPNSSCKWCCNGSSDSFNSKRYITLEGYESWYTCQTCFSISTSLSLSHFQWNSSLLVSVLLGAIPFSFLGGRKIQTYLWRHVWHQKEVFSDYYFCFVRPCLFSKNESWALGINCKTSPINLQAEKKLSLKP